MVTSRDRGMTSSEEVDDRRRCLDVMPETRCGRSNRIPRCSAVNSSVDNDCQFIALLDALRCSQPVELASVPF